MLSYTTAREILLSALSSIGLEKSRYCLHSLRSGGATAAASAGVDDNRISVLNTRRHEILLLGKKEALQIHTICTIFQRHFITASS
jgi:hypothetical protein